MGPSFQWNILNYGRILNNVRFQDATLQELVATYQQTVLNAEMEVENGLITFLRAQWETNRQAAAVDDSDKAVRVVLAQYKAGTTDFTRVTQVEQTLVQQQDVLAQDQGQIATGLIQVYAALGGGWEIRMQGCSAAPLPLPSQPNQPPAEPVPVPGPDPAMPRPPAGAEHPDSTILPPPVGVEHPYSIRSLPPVEPAARP